MPGIEEDKQRALEGLQSAAGFLRSKLAKALTTRMVPELHFELDRGLEHAARINELLEQVRCEHRRRRSRADRRAAGGQAGRPHVARRGGAPAAGAGHEGGGAHRHARSVRDRPAGGAGRAGDPAGAVRRGAGQDATARTLRLGVQTDTDDLTGAPVGGTVPDAWPDEAAIARGAGGDRGDAAAAARRHSRRSTSTGSAATAWPAAGSNVALAPRRGDGPRDGAARVACRPTPTFRVTVSRRHLRAGPCARRWASGWDWGRTCVALRRESIGALQVEDALPLDGDRRPPRRSGRHLRCWATCRGSSWTRRPGRRCSTGAPSQGDGGEARARRARSRWCRGTSWSRWRRCGGDQCSRSWCSSARDVPARLPRAPRSPSARSTACTSAHQAVLRRSARRAAAAGRPACWSPSTRTRSRWSVRSAAPLPAHHRGGAPGDPGACGAGLRAGAPVRRGARGAAAGAVRARHPGGALRHARTGHRARSRLRARPAAATPTRCAGSAQVEGFEVDVVPQVEVDGVRGLQQRDPPVPGRRATWSARRACSAGATT